jgi:hypothetical protein
MIKDTDTEKIVRKALNEEYKRLLTRQQQFSGLMNINGTKSWTTKDFKQANDVRVLQGIVRFTTGKR